MKVMVTDISRHVVKVYADDKIQETTSTNEYNISFTIEANGSYMDTDIDITYNGCMSFDKARELVEDKLGLGGG